MKKTHPKTEPVVLRDVLRVETTLSRFPIHHLARQGTVRIAIRETGADGELALRWEVSYNSQYGPPGPLAYKLDTLIINRRIEEAGRPTPGLIRLGSLSELCRKLGLPDSGKNIRDIRRALLQNASAFITAKVRHKVRDGTERRIEVGDTRYAIVFTGETLPDGQRADAVYLVPHAFYREILDTATTRPLDFDYLRDLPPAAQRLYELLSYHVFATLKHSRPEARMRYSEFCTYAPLTRYTTFWLMRQQMEKVHAPHRQSGYIAKVEYEMTTDREGRPDWTLIYTPGPKAQAEFKAFTSKGERVAIELPLANPELPPPAEVKPPEAKPEPTGLERELVERGVTRAVAADLVRDFPEDRIKAQIEQVDWLREKKPQKIGDLGAYLTKAIREDFAPPASFEGKAQRAAKEAARRAASEQVDAVRQAKLREREAEAQIQAYWEALTPEERSAFDTEALAQADPDARVAYEKATPQVKRLLLVALREALVRHRLGLPATD